MLDTEVMGRDFSPATWEAVAASWQGPRTGSIKRSRTLPSSLPEEPKLLGGVSLARLQCLTLRARPSDGAFGGTKIRSLAHHPAGLPPKAEQQDGSTERDGPGKPD